MKPSNLNPASLVADTNDLSTTSQIFSPSPGTPGEGLGEGDFELPTTLDVRSHPHPTVPELHEDRERGQTRAKPLAHRATALRAFTLVEVMATMMLMSIVLPSVNKGIAAATMAATTARRHYEAAGLAQSKLAELITNGTWQGGTLSGDCGPDWPDYHWQASLSSWVNDTQAVGLQQLDVQILWTARSRQESLTVSGLVYIRPTPTS